MKQRPSLLTQVIGLFVVLCLCMPASGALAWYAWDQKDNISSWLPSVPKSESTNPADQLVTNLLTPPVVDTPKPGETQQSDPPTPTPTQFTVDKVRELIPHDADFSRRLQQANVINGRNVLSTNSGDLFGYAEKTYKINQQVSPPFPFSLVLGDKTVTFYDATFRVTVEVYIDENVYLPAILSQAKVLADPTAPLEQVVINPGSPQEEVVKMYPGTVILPLVNTCYSGFGIKPEGERIEVGSTPLKEKLLDNLYWQIHAVKDNGDVLTWAMPRVRHTVMNAAYNAIMPVQDGQRSMVVLDQIHQGSKISLTQSSGQGNIPSVYDLLLAYFNSLAHDYNISRITSIQYGVIQRGNVYCASDEQLWSPQVEQMLTGDVPANLLIDPARVDPAP